MDDKNIQRSEYRQDTMTWHDQDGVQIFAKSDGGCFVGWSYTDPASLVPAECTWDEANAVWRDKNGLPYDSPADVAIQAQIDGRPLPGADDNPDEPILELTTEMQEPGYRSENFGVDLQALINRHSLENASNTPDWILAKFLVVMHEAYVNATITRDEWRGSGASIREPETNFGFYVDGYTLQGTDTVGEVQAIRYDGKSTTIKSKALTDFLDRRIDGVLLRNEGDD